MMNTVKLIKDELGVSESQASIINSRLPESVVNLLVRENNKEAFMVAVKSMLSPKEPSNRLYKNMRYLIRKLKDRYTPIELVELTGMSVSIIEGLYADPRFNVSINVIQELARHVDLSLEFQPIGEFYNKVIREVQPPTIVGFNTTIYDGVRENTRLPDPRAVGLQATFKRVQIGEGSTFVAGQIETIDDIYLSGALVHGDAAMFVSFEVPDSTYKWVTDFIESGKPERIIMTVGSTKLSAHDIVASVTALDCTNLDNGHVVVSAFIKIPPTKELTVKFITSSDERSTKIDFSQIRVYTPKLASIIVGAVK